MAGDPENKVREGLYVDDERTSIFEKEDDGSTTIHRKFGGAWHSYHIGGTSEAEVGEDED